MSGPRSRTRRNVGHGDDLRAGWRAGRIFPRVAGATTVVQAGEKRSARIESLRALAAMSVLVGHVWLYSQGWTSSAYSHRLVEAGRYGVWLFFALTGYLLFWPFARAAFVDDGSIDLRRYAFNRAVRVLPLYYTVVVVLLILQERSSDTGQWLRFLTLTESFFHSTVGTVDTPIWSLVVEVQFYALLPLLALGLAFVSRRSARSAAWLLAGLAALSLSVWFARVNQPAQPDLRWRYSLPATFFNFTPGMFLALVRASGKSLRLPGSGVLIAGGVALWMVAAAAIRWSAPLCAAGAFLILAAVVLPAREGVAVRALSWRPLALVGVSSYSLYLWHVPLLHWLSDHTSFGTAPLLLVGGALAVTAAAVSYVVVERPFLLLRRRWQSVGPAAQKRDAPVQVLPETVG
jgi:peptidoglycan/LPS O-acetylase OafA/YrhL